jgi:hypothetical protein
MSKIDPSTKQLRAELKDLRRNRRGIVRDFSAMVRRHTKEIAAIKREQITALKNCNRAAARIDQRISILNGRLSA